MFEEVLRKEVPDIQDSTQGGSYSGLYDVKGLGLIDSDDSVGTWIDGDRCGLGSSHRTVP